MTEAADLEPPPQMNGVDHSEEDEERMKIRPADIDADVREMERRKRVEMIMNSRLFREELERIIEMQMKDGGAGMHAGILQQISDMVGGRYNAASYRANGCVVPINDIRGVEAMGYGKGEKFLRCKIAAIFRIMDLRGWSNGVNNNISVCLSHEEERYLVNPYGLLSNEITASSLVKVDMRGEVVEAGTTNFPMNSDSFRLHAAIYSARPDIKCIIQLQTTPVVAVSALRCGLLPLCRESAVLGDISQHAVAYEQSTESEKDTIVRTLGPNNKVMLLTNEGAVCCGETVEEAFFYVQNTVSACEIQLKVLPVGLDNVIPLEEDVQTAIYEAARKPPEGVQTVASPALPAAVAAKTSEKRWKIGATEFEALMRLLDNAGFRTGYVYRHPLVKGDPPRPKNDVELPPSVSSLGYLLEEEEMYKHGQWKKHMGKGGDRIRWLNSPNVYQKVEILETGTQDPKKITKWVDANNEEWVADGSPNHTSTPVKIENALQFVPKNTNPKEFKKLQQQIKENRRADKITSGPQSQILEGVTWEEAKHLQDGVATLPNGDQVILVGAASKGIIQREYQHNATVYKTPYAKNPFDQVTDEEIESYKKDVNKKRNPNSYYDDVDHSESEGFSSSTGLPPSGKRISGGITSDTEDDSLAQEMRVVQIETNTVPKASQAEVVFSDGENTYNGDQSSKENSLTEDSSRKEKKKKKGLRTPSFLKKKEKKKSSRV